MVMPRLNPGLARLPAPLMAAASNAGQRAQQAYAATQIARRVALAREVCPQEYESGKPRFIRFLGEAQVLLEPVRRPRRKIAIAPTANPQVVMLLPGFGAHPMRMRYLARQMEAAGHTAKRWGLGFNWGPTQQNFDAVEERLLQLHARHGRKVVLVGWSLGGLYARLLARRMPAQVRQVITLGSPITDKGRATNAGEIFEFVSGTARTDRANRALLDELATPCPIPSSALYSRSDGVCAWQVCREKPGAQRENIEVYGSHCGLGVNPSVIFAVADRLAQTEGQWRPFAPRGWASWVFPARGHA